MSGFERDSRSFDGARIPSLDGLRGIAILLVLVLHFTYYGGTAPSGLVNRGVYSLALTGWIGVDLFFVLSGFLITGILLDTRNRRDFLRNFYIRRVLRIFPIYYAALLVLLVILPRWVSSDRIASEVAGSLWYWSYLSNVRTAIDGWPSFGFIGHFWTLAVEEQFYLAWPFLVLALEPSRLKRVCVMLIVGALLLRIALHTAGGDVAAYVLMPARMDTLSAGALVAVLLREEGGLDRMKRWAPHLAALSAVCMLALFIARDALNSEDPLVGTIGYSMIALFFASVLVLTLAGERAGRPIRFLRSPPLVIFGKYSYGLYVLHHPPLFFKPAWWSIDALAVLLGARFPAHLLFVAIMIVASLAAALLSWHVLEKHFLRLKDVLAPRDQLACGPEPTAAGGAVVPDANYSGRTIQDP